MAELREENSSLSQQLESAQNVNDGDIVSDAGLTDKVDKNANLQLIHVSSEPSASDAKQLTNSAEQQVMI